MPVAIRELSPFYRFCLRVGVLFFWLIIFSLRVRTTPRAREFLASQPKSNLFLMWHNRMLLALCALARVGKHVPLTALSSTSGDGAITTVIMQAFGMQVIRGSSSRRRVQATRELLAAMAAGRNIVITPDGPRGPIYTVKEGAVSIGCGHAKAIYLLGFNCSRVFQLKSWDKFMIPLPFAKLELDVEKIDENASPNAQMLQDKLNLVNTD